MIAVLLALALTTNDALPPFLRALPWRCEESMPSNLNGIRTEVLSRCTPQGTPRLEAFVQKVADAMGNAGFPPRLSFPRHGPHLLAVRGASMVSVSFSVDGGRFDAWVAVQRMGAPVNPMPILPAGVEVVADHDDDSGKRLVSLHLGAPLESAELVKLTLGALDATALSAAATNDGVSGRLLWQGRAGFYHVTDAGPKTSVLTLYVEPRRKK